MAESFYDAWLPPTLRRRAPADLPTGTPSRYKRKSNNTLEPTLLRPSVACNRSHGILTVCPSAAALAIALGPTNPWMIIIAKETLCFRRQGLSPCLWLLVPTFSLPCAPQNLAVLLHSRWNALLPLVNFIEGRSVVLLRQNCWGLRDLNPHP